MGAPLFGLSLLVLLIGRAWLGNESKTYTVVFCIAFTGLIISIGSMAAQVTGMSG